MKGNFGEIIKENNVMYITIPGEHIFKRKIIYNYHKGKSFRAPDFLIVDEDNIEMGQIWEIKKPNTEYFNIRIKNNGAWNYYKAFDNDRGGMTLLYSDKKEREAKSDSLVADF